MDNYNVIVIGGGLSGLSAAVELCAHGYKALVLEQRRHLGGRAYSFSDAVTSDSIDNGQHLMMGCYHSTRSYMHMIGTESLALLQPNLHIEFFHPLKKSFSFACPTLIPPLHLLGGLLRFNSIPMKNRMEMLNVAMQLLNTSLSKEQELDKLSVEEWLAKCNQSYLSRKFFWDVITIGTLNNHSQNVSALMLFRVLRAVFLGKRENAALLLPQTGLSDVLVNPAIEFIRRNGGDVLLETEVTKVHLEGDKIISLSTQNGKEFRASAFISAVPWFAFERIFSNSSLLSELLIKTPSGKLCDLDQFKASPIISIYLWLDQTILEERFAACIDTRVQWIFNESSKVMKQLQQESINKYASQEKILQQLSLVISGAQEFLEMSKQDLVALAMEDIRSVLPKVKNAKIVHSVVIKERRATFSAVPGLEAMRPLPETTFSNLFLAGDWTNTGLPATIEGAVISGKKAAEMIFKLEIDH
jgi:hydroxysqualene dehydroxylase